jgi:ATP-dependent DNA helicase PIF1
MSETILTKNQKKAFDLIVSGKNVFITGPSGTGKSLIIHMFKTLYGKSKNIGITSTTGISALLIGGSTLHSYLGIGLGQGTEEELIAKISKTRKAKQRWQTIDVLVIDEISMLSPDLFDRLEKVARILRKSKKLLGDEKIPDKPFGGIQLVLTGDFLQLPVVGEDNFCFEAESWEKCVQYTIYLNEIIRQPDPVFQNVLNDIRYGIISEDAKKLLLSRINIELKNENGIKPTRIYTTNHDVDEMNEKELDKLALNNDFYQYDMDVHFYDFVQNKEQALEKARKNCLAPDKLQLCCGAQVMLLHNLDLEQGLANGSRGVVIGFIEDLPVVKFLNGVERIIDHHCWETEEDKVKQLRITQIPLKLAWAITCHRSQGCTLDYAEVNLGNLFAYGQAYVALSRVKTKEGLKILDINFDAIKAHPKAVQFYKNNEE